MTIYCGKCGLNLIKKRELFYGYCEKCIEEMIRKDPTIGNKTLMEFLHVKPKKRD